MMAQDMAWTQQLVNAVLVQRADLMDAVQRLRKRACDYGYLRSNRYYYTVAKVGDYIEIRPVNPQYIYIPAYDPAIVFGPPPPGFVVALALWRKMYVMKWDACHICPLRAQAADDLIGR